MTYWRLKYNSRFVHADTTAGAAGSTTGVPDNPEVGTANQWVDEFGGRWRITSNQLDGIPGGGGTFNTNYLTRPSGEALGDGRIVGYTPTGGFVANRTFSLCLRMTRTATLANSTCYYAEVRTDGSPGIYIYKFAPSPSLLVGPITCVLDTSKYYKIEFTATGTSTVTLVVKVWNLTDGGVLVNTATIADSSSPYTSGREALDLNTAANWSRIQVWETYTPTHTDVAVFLGDSLTYGTNASSGAGTITGTTYPADVTLSLGDAWLGYNVGVSGNTLAQMAARYSTDVAPLFDGAKSNVLVILGGTNDIGTDGQTAAQAHTRLQTLAALGRATGFKIVVVTIPPAQNPAYDVTFNTVRASYNALIEANWQTYADAIADIAQDWRIGQMSDEYDPTYFNGDFTHLTDAGYGVLAGYVIDAIPRALTPPSGGGVAGLIDGGMLSLRA